MLHFRHYRKYLYGMALIIGCLLFFTYAHEREVKMPPQILSLNKTELLRKANTYMSQNQKDSAIIIYSTIISYTDPSDKLSDIEAEAIAKAHINLAGIYYSKNSTSNKYLSYTKAYSHYIQAIELCKKHNFEEHLAQSYLGIGVLYDILTSVYNEHSFTNTIDSLYLESIKLSAHTGIIQTFNISSRCLAANAYTFNKPEMLDTILYYYDEVTRKYTDNSNETLFSKAYCNVLRYILSKDYDRAEEAVIVMEQSTAGNAEMEINAYSLHAELLLRNNRNRDALNYMNKAKNSASKLNNLWINLQIEEGLSKHYLSLGNTQMADSCMLEAYRLRKKMLQEGSAGKIKDLHFNKQIEALSLDLQNMAVEAKYTHRTLVITLVASLIFAVMVVLLLVSNKRLRDSKEHIYEEYTRQLKREKLQTSKAVKEVYNVNQPDKYKNDVKTIDNIVLVNDEFEDEIDADEIDIPQKYQGRQIPEEDKKIILNKVLTLLRETDLLYAPKFQLRNLSDAIGEPARSISQVINEKLGCNFASLLAEYRIKGACLKISESKEFRKLTTEAMAEAVGFQSRSYFSTTFKKITGLTPSEYIKQANRADSYKELAEFSSSSNS